MKHTEENVIGPLLCAICHEPTGRGDFQQEIHDHRGYTLYVFTHEVLCDELFKSALKNPEIEVDD